MNEVAKAEEWPLSRNWWLHIQSQRGEGRFGAFDFIRVEAHGPNDYIRPITSVMVPRIDGFVCESHSFISALIHQNVKAVEQERDQAIKERDEARAEIERLKKSLSVYFKGVNACMKDSEQLTAERAKVAKLRMALEEIRDEKWDGQFCAQQARLALEATK